MKGKVVLGLSGGVDSSTSAYILKDEGFEVIGVTLICTDEQLNSKDLEDAKNITKKLGIKHVLVDIRKEFKEKVINYFLDEYSKGSTPSPCVVCDELIKIENLKRIADSEGAYYIATGHYCETVFNERFKKTLLTKAKDERKDQSYMLHRIEPDILRRIIFPLAKYEKRYVREKAKNYGLEVYDKKDSQGLCFARLGYLDFLKSELQFEIKKGDFVDKDGNVLGQHQGYQLYTIGQRRGLGVIFSRVYFIIDIIPERNQIVLGDYTDLDRELIELIEFKSHIPIEELEELELLAKPRFSSFGFYGKVFRNNGKIYFKYNKKNPQNARGQHLVLYFNDCIVGGGKIKF